MKTRSDVRRRYVLDDLTVEPELVTRERFADIGIEVDFSCRTVRQLTTPVFFTKTDERDQVSARYKHDILPTLGA